VPGGRYWATTNNPKMPLIFFKGSDGGVFGTIGTGNGRALCVR
jgi:hypothetical protein